MKKFSFAKIASLVFICAMILCAFTVTAAFAQDGEETVAIVSNNAYYGEKYQLIYAVDAPDGAKVSATDSEGNELGVALFAEDPTPTIDGVECKAYIITEGVAAQALDEVITLTVEYNSTVVSKSYSFLQYVYERMYVSNIAEGNERAMFEALLAYADAADVYLDGTAADQTASNYKYVTVDGGTLDGQNTAGMFLPGATPFANIEDTLDYNSASHHVEWDVSVNGAEAVRYDNEEIKTLAVSGNMTVTAELVENDCIHVWGDWVETQAATCTEEGSKTRTCTKCSVATETEVIEALGHNIVIDEAVAPTCTETGLTEGSHCTRCDDETVAQETVAALGHNIVIDEAVAPTCTETGLTAGEHCTRCDDATVAQETVAALGHNIVTDEAVAPTCTKTGLTEGSHCTRCDGATVAQEIVAVIAHNYVNMVCTMCKDTNYSGTYYIATIRTSGNYFYMTNDLGTGSTKRYQAVDTGLTALPDAIAAPEDSKVFVLEKNSDGTYSIYAEGITGNNYLGWTSGNSGALVAKASALKFTVNYADGKFNIHFAASDGERYLALNNNSGSDYFAFYKSGQKQDLVLVPVKVCNHTNTENVEAVQPTCYAVGYTAGVRCSDCNSIISGVEEIKMADHTEVEIPAVDATCGEAGSTAGVKCSVCDKVLTAPTIVPATGEHADDDADGLCDVCEHEMGTPDAPTYVDKTYSYTFTASQFSANGDKTLNGVVWTLEGDGGYWGYEGTKGQQLGSGSKPYTSLTLTSAEFTNVKEIKVNTSGASSVNASFTVWVNGVQVGSSTKLTTTATTYTFTLEEAATGKIEIKYTQTSSKAIYIKSIDVAYQEEAE